MAINLCLIFSLLCSLTFAYFPTTNFHVLLLSCHFALLLFKLKYTFRNRTEIPKLGARVSPVFNNVRYTNGDDLVLR